MDSDRAGCSGSSRRSAELSSLQGGQAEGQRLVAHHDPALGHEQRSLQQYGVALQLAQDLGRISDDLGRRYRAQYNDLERHVARLRYATIKAGQNDPAGHPVAADTREFLLESASHDSEHQWIWTPGRPYLSKQHVLDPDSGRCFIAHEHGVPAGNPPSTQSSKWTQCQRHDPDLPSHEAELPFGIPVHDEPPDYGLMLRQHPRITGEPFMWWSHAWIPLPQLDDDTLRLIVRWISDQSTLQYLMDREREREQPVAPCPLEAYPTGSAWLEDTPLYGALADEMRRRDLPRLGS